MPILKHDRVKGGIKNAQESKQLAMDFGREETDMQQRGC